MSEQTGIEWTDSTWNPVRGCTKISPGCKFCYAEAFAERWRGISGHPYEQGFDLRQVPEKLSEPLKWKQPRRIFVNSMSDLFHPAVEDAFIESVFRVMIAANWHVFQVLTKRAERMKEFVSGRFPDLIEHSHIWLGVSVENRGQGVPRIDPLRRTPAAVRFLSVEPLLEDVGKLKLKGIHWVIVGGESGRAPREMKPEWALSVRNQCLEQKVPFFFKQWGGRNKKANGRKLDDQYYDEFPEIETRLSDIESRQRALESVVRLLDDGVSVSAPRRVLQGT
jgi:protein gp37